MAINPTAPGVYIDEISTLAPSVAAVATAIPTFIGNTEQALINQVSLPINTPVRVTSFAEFESIFGGPFKEVFSFTIADKINSADPSTVLSRVITVTLPSVSVYKLYYSVAMFYQNGGGTCYIVQNGDYTTAVVANDLLDGLAAIAKEDEPTLLLFPDFITTPVLSQLEDFRDVYNAALAQCNKLQDRFTIIDVKEQGTGVFADATAFRNDGIGINNLKYGAVYYPFLNTTLGFGYDGTVLVTHTLTDENNVVSAGPLDGKPLDDDPTPSNTVKVIDPNAYNLLITELDKFSVELAPSGAMAGIYARVDRERGVWKAPANVGVQSISGPSITVTASEQEDLNVNPTAGKSINAIRAFTGKGTLVWGARTLAGNDNEWRYVPVRRLFIMAEESIKKASEFVVFEPNDKNTWTRVQTLIGSFLTNLWRDGALAGATPEEAFFVNVGLGTTMTPQDILEGKLIIQVGLAAVRPAEFIILQFMHKLQES